jgi:hypothetical protein
VQIQAPLGRKELDRGVVNMIGSVERFILTPVFPHHPLPINKPDQAYLMLGISGGFFALPASLTLPVQ